MHELYEKMKHRSFVLLIILCLGSLLSFKLYKYPHMFNTTYSTEFLGRIKQDFRNAMESSATNMENRNKTFHEDTTFNKSRTMTNTNVSKAGLKQMHSMNARRLKVMEKNGSFRLPEDLMKAGPFKFLSNYKNPCWLNPDRVKNQKALPVRCLPYFYMIGAPKAGTTDMNRRLIQHPQISSHVPKEPHWLTRSRFTSLRTLRDYQRVFLTSATREITQHIDKEGYHNMVFGDCSASTLWDNYHLNRIAALQNLTGLPYTNADILHHLNPNTKFIVMLRNPVDRLYSDFLYFQHGTPRDFHDNVTQVLRFAKACFKHYSTRLCVYKTLKGGITAFKRIRMQIGIYYIHLEEYFRVFPRDQVMVIKLEDFSNNTMVYMKALFTFLGLEPVNNTLLQKIANPNNKANTRKKKDKRVGDMLPETRKLLEDFYRPFNEKLVKLLGDSFNYN